MEELTVEEKQQFAADFDNLHLEALILNNTLQLRGCLTYIEACTRLAVPCPAMSADAQKLEAGVKELQALQMALLEAKHPNSFSTQELHKETNHAQP